MVLQWQRTCWNGVSSVAKRGVSTVKIEVFPQRFYIAKKGVSNLFNGEKKVFWTVKKEVSPQLLYSENRSVSMVFPSLCFHPKTEEYLAMVTRLNGAGLYGFCMVFQRCCLNGLEKKNSCERCFSREKESYFGVKKVFSKVLTLRKKVFQRCLHGEKKKIDGDKRGVSTGCLDFTMTKKLF